MEGYLPELLASIFPSDALQDFGSAGVFIDEFCDVVDVVVDDYPETLFDAFVRCDLFGGELF